MKKVSKFVVELVQRHVDELSTYTEYYTKTIGILNKKPSNEVLDVLLEEQKAEILSRQRYEYTVTDNFNENGKKIFIINEGCANDEYCISVKEKLIAVD